jgi:hypothetical protein
MREVEVRYNHGLGVRGVGVAFRIGIVSRASQEQSPAQARCANPGWELIYQALFFACAMMAVKIPLGGQRGCWVRTSQFTAAETAQSNTRRGHWRGSQGRCEYLESERCRLQ